MSALFRRELARAFTAGASAVAALFFLLASSIPVFAPGTELSASVPAFARFALFMPYAMCVLIPALTMGLWADEEKNGTSAMILGYPVDELGIAFAKFASTALFACALLALTVPVALLAPAATSAARFANYGALTVASSYAALFLFAAASTSIGAFFSFATRRAVPAFLLSAAAVSAMLVLTANDRIRRACRGSLESADVFFFLAVMAAFLALSDVTLERRRKRA